MKLRSNEGSMKIGIVLTEMVVNGRSEKQEISRCPTSICVIVCCRGSN